jgi:hypothetical protein
MCVSHFVLFTKPFYSVEIKEYNLQHIWGHDKCVQILFRKSWRVETIL